MVFLKLWPVTLKMTTGLTFSWIDTSYTCINYTNIFTWLGIFPVEIDLSRQPPGVYSLEINATDVFNFNDTKVISYTSK